MPGVPPDAIDNLKRVFKGMFKRGKKTKQDQSSYSYAQQQDTPQSQETQQIPPTQATTGSESSAPQLPPVRQEPPLQQSPPDTSKPLPPTHPLATGQHGQPQEAVPIDHNAQPGPPAPVVNTASASDKLGTAGQQEKVSPGGVSPLPASAVDGAAGEPVSAVENDNAPEPPSKTDSGIEAPKLEQQTVTDSKPLPAKENIQAMGTATESTPAPIDTTVAEQQRSLDQSKTTAQEEKVPITMEQPPPIKAVKAAPGMSATSGPLEDFPEGGDGLRDESPTRT